MRYLKRRGIPGKSITNESSLKYLEARVGELATFLSGDQFIHGPKKHNPNAVKKYYLRAILNLGLRWYNEWREERGHEPLPETEKEVPLRDQWA